MMHFPLEGRMPMTVIGPYRLYVAENHGLERETVDVVYEDDVGAIRCCFMLWSQTQLPSLYAHLLASFRSSSENLELDWPTFQHDPAAGPPQMQPQAMRIIQARKKMARECAALHQFVAQFPTVVPSRELIWFRIPPMVFAEHGVSLFHLLPQWPRMLVTQEVLRRIGRPYEPPPPIIAGAQMEQYGDFRLYQALSVNGLGERIPTASLLIYVLDQAHEQFRRLGLMAREELPLLLFRQRVRIHLFILQHVLTMREHVPHSPSPEYAEAMTAVLDEHETLLQATEAALQRLPLAAPRPNEEC